MSTRTLTVRPMTIGAEIVDPPADIEDPDVKAALYRAWLEYGVLFIRGVETIEQHLALSGSLGELEEHPIVHMRAKEHPLFMTVGGETSEPYVYDETEVKMGTVPWHRDTAYTVGMAKGAMLRMLETPPVLGETLFADTAASYDDLAVEVKERISTLEYKSTIRHTPMEQTGPGAIWTTVRPLTNAERSQVGLPPVDGAKAGRITSGFPSVVHPATIVHPESGRTCIFLSPKEFDGFLGLEPDESDELFAYLVRHMLQDRYTYKHSWAVNDVVAWDNRRVMHAAVGNRVGDHRRGLRTTLAGDLSLGRLYTDAVG
jgi:taurine dioxygenase